jgi:predicted membrane metal-binding protein
LIRRARRCLPLLALAAVIAAGAAAQGVRELAFAWAQGDFRSPLTCLVDDTPRQALRRVRVHPGPRHAARPSLRITFYDLEAPAGTRCSSISGEAEPNVIGTLDLVWDARTRPDTGEVDFRNLLRREGGFDFKIDSGRLRVGAVEAGKPGERIVDFAGGTARAEPIVPGSDAARRLAGFGGHRQLGLRIGAPEAPRLSFDLVELEPH